MNINSIFISCSSRMMKGVLPSLRPEIVQADMLYDADLPFGIDEVSEEGVRERICMRLSRKRKIKLLWKIV